MIMSTYRLALYTMTSDYLTPPSASMRNIARECDLRVLRL